MGFSLGNLFSSVSKKLQKTTSTVDVALANELKSRGAAIYNIQGGLDLDASKAKLKAMNLAKTVPVASQTAEQKKAALPVAVSGLPKATVEKPNIVLPGVYKSSALNTSAKVAQQPYEVSATQPQALAPASKASQTIEKGNIAYQQEQQIPKTNIQKILSNFSLDKSLESLKSGIEQQKLASSVSQRLLETGQTSKEEINKLKTGRDIGRSLSADEQIVYDQGKKTIEGVGSSALAATMPVKDLGKGIAEKLESYLGRPASNAEMNTLKNYFTNLSDNGIKLVDIDSKGKAIFDFSGIKESVPFYEEEPLRALSSVVNRGVKENPDISQSLSRVVNNNLVKFPEGVKSVVDAEIKLGIDPSKSVTSEQVQSSYSALADSAVESEADSLSSARDLLLEHSKTYPIPAIPSLNKNYGQILAKLQEGIKDWFRSPQIESKMDVDKILSQKEIKPPEINISATESAEGVLKQRIEGFQEKGFKTVEQPIETILPNGVQQIEITLKNSKGDKINVYVRSNGTKVVSKLDTPATHDEAKDLFAGTELSETAKVKTVPVQKPVIAEMVKTTPITTVVQGVPVKKVNIPTTKKEVIGSTKVIRYSRPEYKNTDSFRGGTWYATPESKTFDFTTESPGQIGGGVRNEITVNIKNPLIIRNAGIEEGSFSVINDGYEKYLPKLQKDLADMLYDTYRNFLETNPSQSNKKFQESVRSILSANNNTSSEIDSVIKSTNTLDAAMDLIISKGLKQNGYDSLILENEYKGQVIDRHIFKFIQDTREVLTSKKATVIDVDQLKNGDFATENHPIYTKKAEQMYDEALQINQNPIVKFTAGGPGSGKSEIITKEIADNFNGIVMDGTLANYDKFIENVNKATQNGKRVEVSAILTDIERAWEYNLKRERKVPLEIFVDKHLGFVETIKKLLQDHPDIPIFVKDTRGISDLTQARNVKFIDDPQITVDKFSKVLYNRNELINKLQKYVKSKAVTGHPLEAGRNQNGTRKIEQVLSRAPRGVNKVPKRIRAVKRRIEKVTEGKIPKTLVTLTEKQALVNRIKAEKGTAKVVQKIEQAAARRQSSAYKREVARTKQTTRKEERSRIIDLFKKKGSEIADIKQQIVTYAKDNISLLQRGKLLDTVKNVQTKGDLARSMRQMENTLQEEKAKELIVSIKDLTSDINNLPIDSKKAIKNFLSTFKFHDLSDPTVQRLLRSKEWEVANYDLPRKIKMQIEMLNKINLKELPLDYLETLQIRLTRLVREGKLKTKLKEEIEKLRLDATLGKIEKESVNLDAVREERLPGRPSKESVITEKKFIMRDLIQKGDFSLTFMDRFFDLLDGGKHYTGVNYKTFYEPIKRANDLYLKESLELTNQMAKLQRKLSLTMYNYERIGIHAIREQANGLEKLISNGYTEKFIDSIRLNERELEMYKWMRNKMDELYPRLSKTYEEQYNESLGWIDNYFPFQTDFDNQVPSVDNIKSSFRRSSVERGFTKQRTQATYPVKIDAGNIFTNYVNNAFNFIHLNKSLTELGKIASNARFYKAIGKNAQPYVIQWLDVLSRNGGVANHYQIQILNTIRRNLAASVLGFKLSSALYQPLAKFNGAAEIGKWAFKYDKDFISNKDIREFAKNASPELQNRIGDDPGYAELSNQTNWKELQRKSLWILQRLDSLTAGSVWYGAYRKSLFEQGIEFNINRVNQEALDYADRVVRITQASSLHKDLPSAFVSKYRDINRTVLTFQTFMINDWNYIKHDLIKLGITDAAEIKKIDDPRIRASEKAKLQNRIAQQMLWLTIAVVMQEAVQSGLSQLYYGEDKTTLKQHLLSAVMGRIPGLSQGYSLFSYDTIPAPAISAIETFAQGSKSLFTGKKIETKIKGGVKASESIAQLFGVPGVAEASKIIRGPLTRLFKAASDKSNEGGLNMKQIPVNIQRPASSIKKPVLNIPNRK